MTAGRDERLVAEGDEHGPGIRPDRGEPDLERARQAAVRLRIDDPARAPPVDGGLDALRVLSRGRPPTPPPPPRPVRPARAGGPAGPRWSRAACRHRSAIPRPRRARVPRSLWSYRHLPTAVGPRVALRPSEPTTPGVRPPMRREAVTDDHRARTDARRRPARSAHRLRPQPEAEAAAGRGDRPGPPFDQRTQLACRCRDRRRRHRPAREPGRRRLDIRLRRRDPIVAGPRRVWHGLCLVRSRGGLAQSSRRVT